MRSRFVALTVAVVLVHLAVSLGHGWAHVNIPVPSTPAQNVFILVVITIAPLVAMWLALNRRTGAGAAVLALSMLGSFLFGVAYHYVIRSPDHVSHVPPGVAGSLFRATALALAIVELAGFLVGVLGFMRASRAGGAHAGELTPRAPGH